MSVFASAAQRIEAELQPDPDWWRGAVIYQVYVRSLYDASGNGVGDFLHLERPDEFNIHLQRIVAELIAGG